MASASDITAGTAGDELVAVAVLEAEPPSGVHDVQMLSRLLPAIAARIERRLLPGVAMIVLENERLVICTRLEDESSLHPLIERLRLCEGPIDLGVGAIQAPVTVGLAAAPPSVADPEELLEQATVALRLAKVHQRQWMVFDPDVARQEAMRLENESRIRRAIGRGDFEVCFQPIFDLERMQPMSVEAVVRWNRPVGALASELGYTVLRRALEQLAHWRRRPGRESWAVHMNLTTALLVDPSLPVLIRQVLDDTATPGSALVLEVSESTYGGVMGFASNSVARLREAGVRVALDDFGAGYSSIAHLRRFPVDMIKLHRDFLTAADESHTDLMLMKAMVDLGRTLQLEVIADGIESETDRLLAVGLGCLYGQGCHLAPASSAFQLDEAMRDAS